MLWLSFTLDSVLDGMGWLEVAEDALALFHPWPSPGRNGMARDDGGCFGFFSPLAPVLSGISGGDGGYFDFA